MNENNNDSLSNKPAPAPVAEPEPQAPISDEEAHRLIELKKNLDSKPDLPETALEAGPEDLNATPKEITSAEALLVKEFEELSHKDKKFNRSKLFKGLVIFSGVGLAVLILVIIGSVFKLDTLVFPVTAYGTIVDFNNRPLADVSVCIQSKCANTDNSGTYTINGLTYGSYDFTAQLDHYRGIQETVPLQRGKNKIDRVLTAEGFGDISGEITTQNGTLITDNLEVMIDNQSVGLSSTNTFSLTGRSIGKFTLLIKSPVYKDVTTDYVLTEGNFDIGKIVLVPASDIKFNVVDWLSGAALDKVTATAGTASVTTTTDGIVQLLDLQITGDLSILVHKDGYVDQTVTLAAANFKTSAVNVLADCSLVRTGRVVYVSNRLGNSNVYSANYDGSDEKMLSDNKGDSTSPMVLADGKTVAFFSTRDQIKNAYNSVIQIPYTANINGGSLTKLAKTNYEDNGGIGDYDFLAMKRVYLQYTYEGGSSKYDVYFGNLDGTGSSKIFEKTGGNFRSFSFANNGEFLIYSWVDYNDRNNDGFYYLKTSTGESRLLYKTGSDTADTLGVSTDRSSVLVDITDPGSYTSDLWLIGVNNNQVTRLTNSSVAETDARFSQDMRTVFFTSARDGKTDLYRVNINGTSETKITNAGNVGSAFLGSNGLAFYTSDKTLYVIDPNAPVQARKVTDNILDDSYTPYFVPD